MAIYEIEFVTSGTELYMCKYTLVLVNDYNVNNVKNLLN